MTPGERARLGGAVTLMREARARGIELWTEGRRLKFKTPGSGISPELRAELTAHREAVVQLLQQEAASRRVLGEMAANQLGMWHLQRLTPKGAAHNVGFAVEVPGGLDSSALKEALQVVVDRHEVLRTDYPEIDGRPRRRIVGFHEPAIIESELESGAPVAEKLRELAQEPFELEGAPLVRVHRLRREEGEILLLVAHHLSLDGISILMVGNEILRVYEALSTTAPPPPSDTERDDYTQFIESQEAWLREEGGRAAQHWMDVLDPPPPLLNLPVDRPRPKIRRLRGATVSVPCGRELSERVEQSARAHGATPFLILLATYTALLRRLTGQSDVTVGTPVHGRSSGRFTTAIGNLANVIPVRTRATADPSFLELLEEVRESIRSSTPYQDYPLPRMAWELARSGGEAGEVIQTIFGLPDFRHFAELRDAHAVVESGRGGDAAAQRVHLIRFDQLEGQFDLALEVFHEGGEYCCSWRYDTDVLDAATIRSWAAAFERLLCEVTKDPERPLSQIPLAAPGEGATVHGRVRTMSGLNLPAALAQRAEVAGDRVAVESATGSYTYRELVEAARGVTGELRAMGVVAGDRVGIMMERGRELVASLIGILGCGASYVPLDPQYPEARLRYMLEDSGVAALVTHRGLEELLSPAVPILDVGVLDGSSHGASFVDVDPEQTAYAIYTSGSTGQPKAVEVPHRAMMNFLWSMAEEPGLSESDTLLAVATISFDMSVLELYLPLLVGARVAIATESETIDGRRLAERLEEAGVTVMQATPATWKLMLAGGWEGKKDLRVFCGGEALPAALAEGLLDRTSELWNMYGPTETTGCVIIHRLERGAPVLIGRPIANTTVYVLDEAMRPLPIGVPGELYIGGAGVAIGYLNRPQLTADRFVQSPFRSGERLYRTGDLARYRHDGRLEHLGRLDHQVKVRGFRIELGEVEAALTSHPNVASAAVDTTAAHGEAAALTAWVQPAEDSEVDIRELRSFLEARLPRFMVPSFWAVLERLPLTPSGKIDRSALARLGTAPGGSFGARCVPPRNAEEEILVDIWSDVLERDDVGVYDDFFELGGQSLLATMVAARVRAVFQLELPLRRLFEEPTIAAIADWVRANLGTHPTLPPIRASETDGPAPLSFSQERMWFLQQLMPTSTAYNMALGTVVLGELDVAALITAITAVERRHTVLRSRIRAPEGRAEQIVRPCGAFTVATEDFSSSPSENALARGVQFASDVLYRPYDLATDAPLRLVVVKVGEARHLVALGLHHVVSDQVSFGLLLRELAALYESDGTEDEVPELPVQYSDFSVWQRDFLDGDRLASDVEYWKQALADVPSLELPTDRPRPRFASHAGDGVLETIPEETLEGLRELSLGAGATPFMVLLAAFNVLLFSRSRQTDLAVGVPTAHRTHKELESLIGTFVNTLVHRNDLSGNPTFREIIARVRETALAAFARQDPPFELLVRELRPERDPGRSPLFQVMFNIADERLGTIRVPRLETEPLMLPSPAAQFDLTLGVVMDDVHQKYHLNYRTDLFDKETAEAMVRHYADIVDRAVRDPDLRLTELAAAPRMERWLLLDEWNRSASRPRPGVGLPAALAQRAEVAGDRVAVESATGSYTYRELVEAARGVTGELRAMGVVAGDRVGMMMERGRELVAA